MNIPLLDLIITIFMIALNLASATAFGIDKLKSKTGAWRIPEKNLLLIALLAPYGAYTAMLLFKHKTRKTKFLLVPIFLITQTYLIIKYQLI